MPCWVIWVQRLNRAEASPRNRDARKPDGETWQTGLKGKVEGLDGRMDRYIHDIALHYVTLYYTTLHYITLALHYILLQNIIKHDVAISR